MTVTVFAPTDLIRRLPQLPQRQDSFAEQAADLCPLLERLGLSGVAAQLAERCSMIESSPNPVMDAVLEALPMARLEVSPQEQLRFASQVAIRLGCYDADDLLKRWMTP